ncbi:MULTISPECIES: hypothetical protein [unclassified Aureimonas]|uniref:hypothetical protein n=1 Tax=unclassified Aureimonas TaxID=2615206 RepID=UPI0006FBDAAF|nr:MULTISPECIES: hypothetical protein [unclassified Aureimonas]KQT80947.1 hypothetical protein ASG54_05690 [Aureimonas sp. Leaf460]
MPCCYVISEWGPARQTPGEIMAMANNGVVAVAACKAAGEQRPNRTVVPCQGARIIERLPERPAGM